MTDQDKKIDKIIAKETNRLQKKRPFVEQVELSFEQNSKGKFFTKIKARTNKKTLFVTEENYCIEKSIKKVFTNLKNILRSKRHRKPNRRFFDLEQAA